MNLKYFMPRGGYLFRHGFLIMFAAAALIISFAMFVLPAARQFLIIDFKTGDILYSADVSPGDLFSITYIHSVNRSPVEDQFRIDKEYSILLQKSIFRSFGAGIPSNPSDGGRFEYYSDRIEVSDINRKIDRLLLFVGVIAEHHFIMNGENIQLNKLSPPQRSVQFLVKRITVYQYFKHKIYPAGIR